MKNKISNTKQKVEDTINMNDKDYLNKLLSCLKEMTKNYTISLTEASNEDLYNKYKETFLKLSKLQRDVFELMFRKGWYELECVDINKLNDKFNMLNNETDIIRTNLK